MAIEFEQLHVEVVDGCVLISQVSITKNEDDVVSIPIEQFRCLLPLLMRDIDEYKSNEKTVADSVR